MLKKAIYLTLFLFLIIGGAGCGREELNKANKVESNLNLTAIGGKNETRNWLTFQDDKGGFEFKCPQEWKIKNAELLSVKVFQYSESPEKDNDSAEGEGFIVTKSNLDKFKNDLDNGDVDNIKKGLNNSNIDPLIYLNNSIKAVSVNVFSIGGGIFIRQLFFMINKDLVVVSIPLPFDNQRVLNWSVDNDEIKEILQDLDNHQVEDQKVLDVIMRFDLLIQTIKIGGEDETSGKITKSEIDGWKKYQSEEAGFEVEFPANWKIHEEMPYNSDVTFSEKDDSFFDCYLRVGAVAKGYEDVDFLDMKTVYIDSHEASWSVLAQGNYKWVRIGFRDLRGLEAYYSIEHSFNVSKDCSKKIEMMLDSIHFIGESLKYNPNEWTNKDSGK